MSFGLRLAFRWLRDVRSHTIPLHPSAWNIFARRRSGWYVHERSSPLSQHDPENNSPEQPLRVSGLASGGEGVGRLDDGRVVFVEGGVPGDLVLLTDWTLKKKLARARIDRLIESSADRVEARCEHFGRCGGCQWQHIRYDAQLEAKRTTVRNALERIGGFKSDLDVAITASPEPYRYRARARLSEFGGVIGYRRQGSRDIEPVESCVVLTETAQDALSRLRDSIGSETEQPLSTEDSSSPRKKKAPTEWIVSSGTAGPAIFQEVVAKRERNADSESITLEVLGEKLRASSNSFMQGNALLWDALADEVCRQCLFSEDDRAPKRFVELYAGIGFLTIPIARRGLSGVAIESDQAALADLTFNLAQTGLAKQVEIVRGRVEKRRDLRRRFGPADVLIVDPPRVGLESSIRDAIASDGPSRVVYVSCDPATLARDLRVLVARGYALSSVQALDLFPQTPHVEVVARLDR